MPDGTSAPTLRDIERFVHTLARAEDPATAENERAICKKTIAEWEREKPGLRAAALRVTAALAGEAPRAGGARTNAQEEMAAAFARFADTSVPLWQRMLHAVAGVAPHAGEIVEQYRGALAQFDTAPEPLPRGQYEVRTTVNAHGELDLRVRITRADAAIHGRRLKLMDVIAKKLAGRSA